MQAVLEELRGIGQDPRVTQYSFCTNGSHYAGEAGIRTIAGVGHRWPGSRRAPPTPRDRGRTGYPSAPGFPVETFGVPAHSANPEKGVNAVYAMCRVVEALRELEAPVHPVLGKGILELTDIRSSPYPGAAPFISLAPRP